MFKLSSLLIFMIFSKCFSFLIQSIPESILNPETPSDLPLLKPIYTVNSQKCLFPFEFQGKIYYECVPEFQFLGHKNSKILFFWCFYQDPFEFKLKKGYCKSEDFMEVPKNAIPLNQEQLSLYGKSLNKINSLKVLQEIYKILEKTVSNQFFDKCLNISQISIESLNFTCVKSSFSELLKSGKVSKEVENKLVSRLEQLEIENIQKKQLFEKTEQEFQQFRFFSRDLQKNEGKPQNLTEFYCYNNKLANKFQEFLVILRAAEKNCNIHCFEYFQREINRKFTKPEIQRLKMEVYARINGYTNISSLLSSEKDCSSNENTCSFDQNTFQIDSPYFHYRFWSDFTLINKIFRLLYNKELTFNEIFQQKPQQSLIIGNYEQIDFLVSSYKNKLDEVIEKFYEKLNDVEKIYDRISETIGKIETNINQEENDFNGYINKISLNISQEMTIFQNSLTEEADFDKLIQSKNAEIKEKELNYYELLEKKTDDFYKNLGFSKNYFRNRNYFCKSQSGIGFQTFQKSRNLQGPSQIGHQIQPSFSFDSTGPFSLKLRFGLKPLNSDNFNIKIGGMNDNFRLFINDCKIMLESNGIFSVSKGITLNSGEIYEVYLEIRRKAKNINKKYQISLEWKSNQTSFFEPLSPGVLCGLSDNFYIDCEKFCNHQFSKCFSQKIITFDSCVTSCSFYKWSQNTLLCLKPFLKNGDLCNSPSFFAYVFGFCLLSGDLKLKAVFTNVWESRRNEYSEENFDQNNKTFKITQLLSEKPIVLVTGNKHFFLQIDPYYFCFESRIIKLHPLTSHEKTRNKAFLYYPANKHRSSNIITVQNPKFSEQDLQNSSIQIKESILFMENFAFNVDFINSQGGSFIFEKQHWCLPPKIFENKADFFQENSQVFEDLDYYFVKIPNFLDDFYIIKTPGYPNIPLQIKSLEPIEVFLAIEYSQEKMSLDDLDYIERLTNEGWKMIEDPFNELNIITISNIPAKKEETIQQCFWDDWNQKSICKDYKPNYGDNKKKFAFWEKTINAGDNFQINNGFLQIISFVRALECRAIEVLCTEGQEDMVEIDMFLEENEENSERIDPFVELLTNINDCIWGLDDSGSLYYRKGVDEIKRTGK